MALYLSPMDRLSRGRGALGGGARRRDGGGTRGLGGVTAVMPAGAVSECPDGLPTRLRLRPTGLASGIAGPIFPPMIPSSQELTLSHRCLCHPTRYGERRVATPPLLWWWCAPLVE